MAPSADSPNRWPGPAGADDINTAPGPATTTDKQQQIHDRNDLRLEY